MGIDELLETKREEILRVAARHGAYNVRVFGSKEKSLHRYIRDRVLEEAVEL